MVRNFTQPESVKTLSDPRRGFSFKKSQAIGRKAFALSDWFKARGEKPDEWMDLFSEIILSDEPPSEADIARAQELAAKHGWDRGGTAR